MAVPKAKKPSVAQVLKLVDQLSSEEQYQLIEQMKLQWLSRAMHQAKKSLAQGKVYSEDEVTAYLDETRDETRRHATNGRR